MATELLKGKTAAEAKTMSGEELAAPLGALPPVKIHCAQLVEGALRNALGVERAPVANQSPTLLEKINTGGKVKVVFSANEREPNSD